MYPVLSLRRRRLRRITLHRQYLLSWKGRQLYFHQHLELPNPQHTILLHIMLIILCYHPRHLPTQLRNNLLYPLFLLHMHNLISRQPLHPQVLLLIFHCLHLQGLHLQPFLRQHSLLIHLPLCLPVGLIRHPLVPSGREDLLHRQPAIIALRTAMMILLQNNSANLAKERMAMIDDV